MFYKDIQNIKMIANIPNIFVQTEIMIMKRATNLKTNFVKNVMTITRNRT